MEAALPAPSPSGCCSSAAGALTLGAATRQGLLVVVGAGGLVAVLTPSPLHDVGLLTLLLGWALVGALRLRRREEVAV